MNWLTDTPSLLQVADLLDDARGQLTEHGHRIGIGFNSPDGVCFGEAIALAARCERGGWPNFAGDASLCPAGELIYEYAKAVGIDDGHGGGLWWWNDCVAANEDDVHDLMLNIAKAMREDASKGR